MKRPESIPLINNLAYSRWQNRLMEVSTSRALLLWADHKTAMLALYGRQGWTLRSEYLHYIWEIPFEGQTFRLFTGRKGTSFELITEATCAGFRAAERLGAIAARFTAGLGERLLQHYRSLPAAERPRSVAFCLERLETEPSGWCLEPAAKRLGLFRQRS